jgi:hypothetical protein
MIGLHHAALRTPPEPDVAASDRIATVSDALQQPHFHPWIPICTTGLAHTFAEERMFDVRGILFIGAG